MLLKRIKLKYLIMIIIVYLIRGWILKIQNKDLGYL